MFSVKEIESNELAQKLEQKSSLLLIDVRTPQEMAQASIPEGKPLPLSVLPLRTEEIPKDQEVIFYCHTGARSAQACLFMAQRGYQNTYSLRGGILSWARQGLPILPKLA